MKHYSLEDWTDYVRGLAGEAKEREMRSHLLDDCGPCARMEALLRNVAVAAKQQVDVPDTVVARAHEVFAPRRVNREPVWRRLVAALTFDSGAVLALEGVRSMTGGIRRLSFQVEDFEVDLLVDRAPSTNTWNVTGQISMARPAARTVVLLAGRKEVQRTVSNEFGEFQLEFPAGPGLRLRVPDEAGKREIEVPLASVIGVRRAPKN